MPSEGLSFEDLEAEGAIGGADKYEKFGAIMARVGSQQPTWRSPPPSPGDSSPGTTVLRAASASAIVSGPAPHVRPIRCTISTPPRRAMHTRPFGAQRAVGGLFAVAPPLPQRDLTAWEMQRAVSPERSWPTASSDCLRTSSASQTWVASSPSQSSLHDGLVHSYGVALRARETDVRGRLDLDHEVLTPVRLVGEVTYSPGVTLRPSVADGGRQGASSIRRAVDKARSSLMNSGGSGFAGPAPWSMRADDTRCDSVARTLDATTRDDLRVLQERRRRLAAELRRTDMQSRALLAQAAAAEAEAFLGTVFPGGGGGSTMWRHAAPSAGGPFAGPRGTMHRSTAEAYRRSQRSAAATSYLYLGPHSEGSPVPEIHPMWS